MDAIKDSWESTFMVFVYYNGVVTWVIPDYFESLCYLNMRAFPFDTQICSLNFGNMMHDSSQVDLNVSLPVVDTEFYMASNQFE